MPIKRPEESGPPENFYDKKEARKYTSSSRIIRVQAEIADRCIELLNLEPGKRRLVLDVGCGSGLSGAALERAGHAWVGCDVSRHMLRIASERRGGGGDDDEEEDDEEDEEDDESMGDSDDDSDDASDDGEAGGAETTAVASAELLEHDMGLGLPFRPGTFDGAVSVSALQWLCYDNATAQRAPRRLARFFSSLHACLRAGGRAALQFYPENDAQARMIAAAASRAGFSGGVVVDFPNSTKARKHYLCLSTERQYRAPAARADAAGGGGAVFRGRRRGRKAPKDKSWILQKKAHQRRQGRSVKADSKFTGRKRRDRF